MLLFELKLYDVVEFGKVLSDGWFVRRGEYLGNDWDTSIKTVLKLMREVRVSRGESTAFEELLPGI